MKLHFRVRVNDFMDRIAITTPDGDRIDATDVYISLINSLSTAFGFEHGWNGPFEIDGKAFIVSDTILRGKGVVVAIRDTDLSMDAARYNIVREEGDPALFFDVCTEGLDDHFGGYPRRLYFKRNERLDV